MSGYPIVVDKGSEIHVLPFPNAKKPALRLNLADSRRLLRDVGAVLAAHDRANIEREAALLSMLRRFIADAAGEYRGKGLMPHQVPRRVWQAALAPILWVQAKSEAPPVPKVLEGLLPLFVGNIRVIEVLRTEIARYFRLTATPFTVTGALDMRHDHYVASAVMAGQPIPVAVLADYPASYWRASDLPWVEYHLDPAGWASALVGRAMSEVEAKLLHDRSSLYNKAVGNESHLAALHRMSPAGLELMLERRAA